MRKPSYVTSLDVLLNSIKSQNRTFICLVNIHRAKVNTKVHVCGHLSFLFYLTDWVRKCYIYITCELSHKEKKHLKHTAQPALFQVYCTSVSDICSLLNTCKNIHRSCCAPIDFTISAWVNSLYSFWRSHVRLKTMYLGPVNYLGLNFYSAFSHTRCIFS